MNSKDDFSESIRSGLNAWRLLTAKRIAMRNDPTTPGREEKREADEDLRRSGMERGCQRGFLRTRPASRWRHGTRAVALFASWYCSTAFYNQLVKQSVVPCSKYCGKLADFNTTVSVYLTREWIHNLIRRPLLHCDNFLRVHFSLSSRNWLNISIFFYL